MILSTYVLYNMNILNKTLDQIWKYNINMRRLMGDFRDSENL
jgi:hypothetical protein